jgi:hypothetical protein
VNIIKEEKGNQDECLPLGSIVLSGFHNIMNSLTSKLSGGNFSPIGCHPV